MNEQSSRSAAPAGGASKDQSERTILINFVLDSSGSMEAIRQATISGFNEFLGDQQREGGSARMTLTLFDTDCHVVAREVPVAGVRPLTFDSYRPRGCTALYDAIGHTMGLTDDYVLAQRPDQVLFVIMTDGEENSSREYDRKRIFELISKRQEQAGYEFIYLGANQDAYAASESMGIAAGHALNWDATPDAATATMQRLSHNVRAHRRSGAARQAAGAFFSPAFEQTGATEREEHAE